MHARQNDDGDVAGEALAELAKAIARTSVRASNSLGVDFDVDDLRVARWLMLATFEGLFMPSSKTTAEHLLAQAAACPSTETGKSGAKKGGRQDRKSPLVTWDDLVAASRCSPR
jgi:hypothetical protein